jgi:diaminopimelate dehydrogenase
MQYKIKAAIVGYGNIGKYVLESLETAPDFEVSGIVRRDVSNIPIELKNYRVVTTISELENIDVAFLTAPTRSVESYAIECLKLGINTVDSFDIHSKIVQLRESLNIVAKENNAVSIVAAGWDPGSDSVIRTLLEALAPKGLTYTNFGPGMSMGHTVAVKAIKGVRNALSMTIPIGTGVHRRMVYIELEDGFNFQSVSKSIKEDEYFVHDDTYVLQVDDVDALKDMGHGVLMERKGVSGKTQNQLFSFDMRINNPALTAQVLVSSARATMKQQPGAYTLIEIPVVDLLPGEKEYWIKKLV